MSGEYQGVIPNTDDQLGAKLYSDCSSPGIMFYSVLSRGNHSHIYEGETRSKLDAGESFSCPDGADRGAATGSLHIYTLHASHEVKFHGSHSHDVLFRGHTYHTKVMF